jgi:predicted ribonuclease YlaK
MAKSRRNQVPDLYVIGGQKLLPINKFHINRIAPKTNNQDKAFRLYSEGFNLSLLGSAGTGKTFIAMHLALVDVMDIETPYDRIVIVRSTVPTRNQGFLPGSLAEKQAVYEMPYKSIVRDLISSSITGDVYEKLKAQKSLEFISTSFVRGMTIDNAVIVVDEASNLNFHELDSIITRVGSNSKIIFCGDTRQSDLHENDKREHVKFMQILDEVDSFRSIQFGVEDIVRSGLVKSYLIARDKLGY